MPSASAPVASTIMQVWVRRSVERLRAHPDATLVVEGLLLFLASAAVVQLVEWISWLAFASLPPSLTDLCRWDCRWYGTIVNHGYQTAPEPNFRGYANWAFFPVFPAMARGVAHLTQAGTMVSLVLTSRIMYAVSIVLFMLLLRRLMDARAALLGGAVLAFNPYLVYGHVGYSEPLYFALTAAGFLLLQQKRWVWAGVLGAVLSATRVPGLLFAVPYLVAVIRNRGDIRRDWPRMVLGAVLLPLGIALFALSLSSIVGDGLAFEHVQVAWGRSLDNPIEVLWLGLLDGGWSAIDAVIGIAAIAVSVWFIVRREYEYGMFLLFATVIPISEGLLSLPRFVFWQVPMLYGIVRFLHGRRRTETLWFALAGVTAAIVLLGWFSGKSFVI